MNRSQSAKRYYWTEKRIVAGISILNEANVPLALGELIRDATHPFSKTLSRAIGARVSAEGLHRAACNRFGTWEAAIRKAGFTPVLTSDLKIFWKKQLVLQAIVALFDEGAPITHPRIYKHRSLYSYHLFHKTNSPKSDRILSKVAGRPATRQALFRTAIYYFGSWERAVELAFPESVDRWHVHFWTRTRIVVAIRALHKAGLPLNCGRLWRDRSPKTTRVLKKAVERSTTGAALYQAGRTYFPSWEHAVQAAGLSLGKIRLSSFWNSENIVAAIQALNKKHVPLNSRHIGKDFTIRTKRILKNAIGQPRTGNSLVGAACRILGTWDIALRVAGLDPKEIRRVEFRWNKYSIATLIKALHSANVPLSEKRFSKDRSKRTREIIFRMTGRRTKPSWIIKTARWKFGSWDVAIEYALKPKSSAFSENEKEEAKDDLAVYIRRLYDDGFEMNYRSVWTKSRLIIAHNERSYGEKVSGFMLINAAKKYLGNWDAALKAAHLEPSEIRKARRAHTSVVAVISSQVERTNQADGSVRYSRFAGEPPKTPDTIIEDRERFQNLYQAIDDLEDDDRDTAEQVFDMILKIPGFLNQKDLIKAVARLSEGSLTESRVQSVLSQLSHSLQSR